MTLLSSDVSSIEQVILPQLHSLGDGFEVRRALPSPGRQMVGPFIFFDAFGPAVFGRGQGVDVRPHPHIGLATLTYLIEGAILHRDSAGHVQAVGPGDVSLMTSGRGIVHSERTPPDVRAAGATLLGQQVWLALPRSLEDAEPGFAHHDAGSIPRMEGEGVVATLIAGDAFGRRSPVATFSDTVYADITLAPRARLQVDAKHYERAIHIVSGTAVVVDQLGTFVAGELVVFRPGTEIVLSTDIGARLMLIGGEPLPEPRFIHWNFVASSLERIHQAMADWRKRRFPGVPGETEYIPLPPSDGTA